MTDLLTDTETWIPSYADFGARLAAIRWRMRWNMKEAALACGVPAQNWRIWELDGVLPRDLVTVAQRISDRSGVDLDWLLRGPIRPSAPDVVLYRRGSQRRSTGGYISRPADERPAPRSRPSTPRRTVQSAA